MKFLNSIIRKTRHQNIRKLIEFIYIYPIINSFAYIFVMILSEAFIGDFIIVDAFAYFTIFHGFLMFVISYLSGFCIFHRVCTMIPMIGTVLCIINSANPETNIISIIIVTLIFIFILTAAKAVADIKKHTR